MLDSGALTAGIVANSEEKNRGSILAIYSMIGFTGSVIGPPTLGLMLYINGGIEDLSAWRYALLTMVAGSISIIFFQSKFFLKQDIP